MSLHMRLVCLHLVPMRFTLQNPPLEHHQEDFGYKTSQQIFNREFTPRGFLHQTTVARYSNITRRGFLIPLVGRKRVILSVLLSSTLIYAYIFIRHKYGRFLEIVSVNDDNKI